jgi:hypothetical protein
MATAMFAETLENSQHSTRLIPESRSKTLNSNRENIWTVIPGLDVTQEVEINKF